VPVVAELASPSRTGGGTAAALAAAGAPGAGAAHGARARPRRALEDLARALSDLGPAGLLPLLVLVGLAGVTNFDVAAFGVLAPDIRSTFHLSNAGFDAIVSLTGAVPIVFAVVFGYGGDRYNRLRISRGAGLLWGLTAILTGLAPAVGVLVAARIVGGVGLLSAETVTPSLLSDYYPPRRLGTVYGVFRFGGSGLALLGSPLSGVLGAVLGWRPTFVALAMPTFVLVGLLGLLHEPARGASQGLVTAAEEHRSIGEGYRRVRAIRTLRRTWVGAFLFGSGTVPIAAL
jgi:MFS family permease